MAAGEGSSEPDEDDTLLVENGKSTANTTAGAAENESEDEDEEEEPRLKYATLTKSVSSLYRNGDATSAVLVAGDKMIVGTHNGNIHVLSLPALQSLKVYHAHTASVSSISISPNPPPLPTARPEGPHRQPSQLQQETSSPGKSSPGAKNSPKQPPVPPTASNQIHIATSSIDGNVCVASLVDEKDVQLRNFGRPVQAVALSPEYKTDRAYLSGGQAGSLVLTTGGQAGKSVNAATTGAAAAASGWLGSLGLGPNTGIDKVLHSGEGTINTIKWSRSGKFVLWVNEQGIKIMRSNLKLESGESGSEWTRISHVDRPARAGWEEMAGVWRARVEWIDRDSLETEDDTTLQHVLSSSNGEAGDDQRQAKKEERVEEVVIGWGDNVWILKVYPSAIGTGKEAGERRAGRAEIITNIRFNDCTISGTTLYTPKLLLILAYMEKKGTSNGKQGADGTPRKGRHHRSNALEPELRLIDVNTKEEVDTDTLSVSRFESLSAADYHLAILPPTKIPHGMTEAGYWKAIGSGVETVGTGLYKYTGTQMVAEGMWDATKYSGRMLGANRLFSGAESVRSDDLSGDQIRTPGSVRGGTFRGSHYLTGWIPGFGSAGAQNDEARTVATTQSMKIFVYSPYDCIVAVKRNLADRLQWLIGQKHYENAWDLLDRNPEAAGAAQDNEEEDMTSPNSPSKASSVAHSGGVASPTPARARQQNTLADFFADSTSLSSTPGEKKRSRNSAAEKEKRRIGELWLQQLVAAKEWQTAAEVAGKVLNTTSRWEHWTWVFIRNKKFDEISPVIPTFQISPPLPPLIFEIILGHYVSTDRKHFKELIDVWPTDLFELSTISTAIEDQLKPDITPKDSTDWRLLEECLAKLYLAEGRYQNALRCYVRLQDADTALTMIKEHHLVDTIADDIPSLVLLRISPDQLKTSTHEELAELSSDPIKLLVDEATHGVVEPQEVVGQLEEAQPSLMLFLFFYLRALWRGEGMSQKQLPRIGLYGHVTSLQADEGKTLVDQFADMAVDLFAEYDRELLMEYLQTSTSYTFEKAVKVCERRHYVEELVYLLSKTGQMKKALFLIINELNDVSKAIAFAKEQDDKDLWDDLLEYSMSRPRFISSLLIEVGTAIDPITLVKRIPSGLEIEGLKDGLKKMIREYDLQDSISSGAAKVMASEVAVGMQELRQGRRKGIKFDILHGKAIQSTSTPMAADAESKTSTWQKHEPGRCVGCNEPFTEDEKETLFGFACGHVYHFSHLAANSATDDDDALTPPPEMREGDDDDEDEEAGFSRTVKSKVTLARLLRDKVEAAGGCRVCMQRKTAVADA